MYIRSILVSEMNIIGEVQEVNMKGDIAEIQLSKQKINCAAAESHSGDRCFTIKVLYIDKVEKKFS